MPDVIFPNPSLPVECSWVHPVKENHEQLPELDQLRVEDDLHRLGVSRPAPTYLPVGRLLHLAICVPDHGANYTGHSLQNTIGAIILSKITNPLKFKCNF